MTPRRSAAGEGGSHRESTLLSVGRLTPSHLAMHFFLANRISVKCPSGLVLDVHPD
jgi:hypothetical protein